MTTEERLEKLEKDLAAVMWHTIPQAYHYRTEFSPKSIRAEEFVLVDQNGKGRAWLRMSAQGGPGLSPSLELCDETGAGRVILVLRACGLPSLWLCDKKGAALEHLSLSLEGPGLRLEDKNGRAVWSGPER